MIIVYSAIWASLAIYHIKSNTRSASVKPDSINEKPL